MHIFEQCLINTKIIQRGETANTNKRALFSSVQLLLRHITGPHNRRRYYTVYTLVITWLLKIVFSTEIIIQTRIIRI